MLNQMDLKNVPKVVNSFVTDKRLVHVSGLKSLKRPITKDEIKNNNFIQVAVALLYSINNPEFPIEISIPMGLSNIEILSSSFIKIIPSVFKEYRFVTADKHITAVHIKGLLPETENLYRQLRESEEVDPSVLRILRINNMKDLDHTDPIAFEITNNELSSDNIIHLILSNILHMYLVNECIRNHGVFALPLYQWRKEEIEQEPYFLELKKIFQKVCVVGTGRPWCSTHLIVANPFQEIVSCDYYFK